MNIQEIKKYLKKNDPALWKSIGKEISNPLVLTNELIRHYQWIFMMGDIDWLDMSDRINKNYKNIFIYCLDSSKEFSDDFLNYFINSLKIAYDYQTKRWDPEIIMNILVNNKRIFWFDLAAIYTLIAATHNKIRNFILDLNVDVSIQIPKEQCIKLFDRIIDQKFYDELKSKIKSERINTLKNIYLYE